MESDTKMYNDYRDYLKFKYGSAYLGAISKLSTKNPYDEHGLLKTEFALTDEEKEALLFYVPIEQPNTQPNVNYKPNDDFNSGFGIRK